MQITLEGHPPPVTVLPGETVLAALLRAGLPFPFACQTGNCGSCKCRLLAGEVIELERAAHVLTGAERASGVILACRSQPRRDLVVRRLDL